MKLESVWQRKVTFEESPYTYVRTTVMRTLLIPKQEYRKMLNMTVAEITNYLRETQYRKEIDALAIKYSDSLLIEHVLKENFVKTVEKLKNISPASYTSLISAYLLKYDIDNLKTILRAKKAHLSKEELHELIVPVGILSMQQLGVLWQKEKVEDMLKMLPEPLDALQNIYKNIKTKSSIEVETAFDHFYFSTLVEFTSHIPRQGAVFRDFLFETIHTNNILTFLRLKKEGMAAEEIRKYIFFTKDDREKILMEALLTAKDEQEIQKLFSKSKYKEFIQGSTSLITIEMKLQKRLLEKTLLFHHQNPLSVYVILSYLFAKEIEMQNIKRIIKAKQLGVDLQKIDVVIA